MLDTHNSCETISPNPQNIPLGKFIMEAERIYLQKCLELTSNNKTEAAKLAGISRSTLKDKLSRYKCKVTVELL